VDSVLNELANRKRVDHRASSLGNPTVPAPDQTIRVHIVAPSLLSWCLHRLLQSAGAPFRVLSISPSLPQGLPLLARSAAEVVLLDLDDGYGPEEVAELSGHFGAEVIVLTCAADRDFHDRILRAGARAIFHKHQAPGHLLKAIESIAVGGSAPARTPPARAASVLPGGAIAVKQADLMSLTARERETVAAVVAGASAPARVIAARLGMSEHTLRNHLSAIYSKLQVSGRLGLHALVQRQPGAGGRLC
jgi:two-component system, NarL family, nitrate/nitrite response regulator NarL